MSDTANYLGGGAGVGRDAIQQEYFRKINETKSDKIETTQKNQEFSKVLDGKFNSTNKLEKRTNINQSGTDFALKKVAQNYEKQFLGLMWNFATENNDGHHYEGGMGEEIFRKEVVNEMTKSIRSEEMGNLAKSIYEELKKQTDSSKKE